MNRNDIYHLISMANEAKTVGEERGYPIANAITALLLEDFFVKSHAWDLRQTNGLNAEPAERPELWVAWETADIEGTIQEEWYYDIATVGVTVDETEYSLSIPVPMLTAATAVSTLKAAVSMENMDDRDGHGREFLKDYQRLSELWEEFGKLDREVIFRVIRKHLDAESAEEVLKAIKQEIG